MNTNSSTSTSLPNLSSTVFVFALLPAEDVAGTYNDDDDDDGSVRTPPRREKMDDV